jgi:hypothetical protein
MPHPTGNEVLVRDGSSHVLKTNAASSRNIFFEGPNMPTMKDYTVTGSFKFDSANAVFGVTFNSQWPTSPSKYTLLRETDNRMHLYYDMDENNSTPLGVVDTTPSRSDAPRNVNTWYEFKVKLEPLGSGNEIRVWCVEKGRTMPDTQALDAADSHLSNGGLVGLNTITGTGNYRYWGPLKVVSNAPAPQGTLANEDFRGDTVVDAVPYVPANWLPQYGDAKFAVGLDTTGFMLRVNAADTALVYKHKPNVNYPVTCLLAPSTNLEWRNYQMTGTITKPAGEVYDSVEVGLVFYSESPTSYYKLTAGGKSSTSDNSIHIVKVTNGVPQNLGQASGESAFEGAVDVLHFGVQVRTMDRKVNEDSTIVDGRVEINAKTWTGVTPPSWLTLISDTTGSRKIQGVGGVLVNLRNTGLAKDPGLAPIRFDDFRAEKLGE